MVKDCLLKLRIYLDILNKGSIGNKTFDIYSLGTNSKHDAKYFTVPYAKKRRELWNERNETNLWTLQSIETIRTVFLVITSYVQCLNKISNLIKEQA